MPWHVEHGGGTCDASEWAVIKDSDGSTAGCHPTQEAAQRQVAALYANEGAMSQNGSGQDFAAAGRSRAAAVRDKTLTVPSGEARSLSFPSTLRATRVQVDGRSFADLHGTATAYEQPYEMWDVFGPYNEVVSRKAGSVSLAGDPDVAFLVNHKGLTMARTTNGTLQLSESDDGLDYAARVNPERQDIRDLLAAVDDGLITESSFAFMITEGLWNDDFTEYRINGYDINRGDVSAVNYGANPYTSVAARQREILADLRQLPLGAARHAIELLAHREDVAAPQHAVAAILNDESGGYSVALWQAMLDAE